MKNHDSSFVRSVGYDWDTGTLRMKLGKRVYEYLDVPESDYQRLLSGKSLGETFNKVIKPNYSFREVTS